MTDEETVQFTLRIPVSHAAVLKQLAAEEDRTPSAEIRRLIRRHVEASDLKKAA